MDWEGGKAYINPSPWHRYFAYIFNFFLWWRKPKNSEKTTVHSQSVDNSPHIRPGRESNPGRRGGRPERCRSANRAPIVRINSRPSQPVQQNYVYITKIYFYTYHSTHVFIVVHYGNKRLALSLPLSSAPIS